MVRSFKSAAQLARLTFGPLRDLASYRLVSPSKVSSVEGGGNFFAKTSVLVTCGFGAERYSEAARRLGRQAQSLGCFEHVLIFTDLSQVPNLALDEFAAVSKLAAANSRGWGLWSWKPVILSSVMRSFPDGTEIFYIDAGCEISPWGLVNFNNWRAHLSSQGALFFYLPFREKNWTNSRVLKQFSVAPHTDRLQIQATWFGLINSDRSRNLMTRWADYCLMSDGFLLKSDENDSNDELVEHREDQSILSCLVNCEDWIRPLAHQDHFLPELYARNSWVLTMPVHTLRQTGGVGKLDRLINTSVQLESNRYLSILATSLPRRLLRASKELVVAVLQFCRMLFF